MSQQFLLPDLGEGLTEAEIVSWLVAPGDIIVVDQPVVEVESAKSIVELPSPYGGRVERLDAAPGQTVSKGASLLTIVALDGAAAGAASSTENAFASGHTVSGSGAVLVGYGTKESTVRLARPDGGRFGRGTNAAVNSDARTGAGSTGSSLRSTASADLSLTDPPRSQLSLLDPARRSPVVSPIVRARARANGFDAHELLGSGAGSLVCRDDVEAAITARAAASAGAVDASASAAADSAAADLHIPLVGMRKLVASRLSESRRLVPEVTLWLDVDLTELLRAKERLLAVTGEKFSLTTLIARFVVAGLRNFPILNSSVVSLPGGREEILQHGTINLGIAAQTPRGLMVPVVHGADNLTTRQLRDAISTLVTASAEGNFAAPDLAGGTFTLNNYGAFGVDGSTPIINYPEVAMLGIGRIKERPWVINHELAVREVMVLAFVFDHRVCDGDVASAFLTFVAGCIEEPLLLLGTL